MNRGYNYSPQMGPQRVANMQNIPMGQMPMNYPPNMQGPPMQNPMGMMPGPPPGSMPPPNYGPIPQGFPPGYIPSPQYSNIPKITKIPKQDPEVYHWEPRKDVMNWKAAEAIDVQKIVSDGDLQSVKFYMQQFVKANFTKDDYEKFGSKGALQAFLILQLGCDYLLHQNKELTKEQSQKTQKDYQELYEKHEIEMNKAEQTVKECKDQITILKSQVTQLHDERRKQTEIHKKLCDKIMKLKKQLKNNPKENLPPSNNDKFNDSEPGAVHDKTALQSYKDHQLSLPKNHSKAKPKQRIHDDTSSQKDEYSEGEVTSGMLDTSNSDIDIGSNNGSDGEIIDDDTVNSPNDVGEYSYDENDY